jgi:hypothetical protein
MSKSKNTYPWDNDQHKQNEIKISPSHVRVCLYNTDIPHVSNISWGYIEKGFTITQDVVTLTP